MSKPIGYKPFSQGNYDESKWVEKVTFNNLQLNNKTLELNLYMYGIDIFIRDNITKKLTGAIEVESHGKYWDKKFKYNTVHFLGRKIKIIEKDKQFNYKKYYIMVNSDGTQAVMIPFDKLSKYDIELQNNNSCNKEPMYNIKNKDCIWGWDLISSYINNDLK